MGFDIVFDISGLFHNQSSNPVLIVLLVLSALVIICLLLCLGIILCRYSCRQTPRTTWHPPPSMLCFVCICFFIICILTPIEANKDIMTPETALQFEVEVSFKSELTIEAAPPPLPIPIPLKKSRNISKRKSRNGIKPSNIFHRGAKMAAEAAGTTVLSALTFLGMDAVVDLFEDHEEAVGYTTFGFIGGIGLCIIGTIVYCFKKNKNTADYEFDKINQKLEIIESKV